MKLALLLLFFCKTVFSITFLCEMDSFYYSKLQNIINICDSGASYEYLDTVSFYNGVFLSRIDYVGLNVIKKDGNYMIVRKSLFAADIDSSKSYGYMCDTVQYDTIYNYKTQIQYSTKIIGNIKKYEVEKILDNFYKFPLDSKDGQVISISKENKYLYEIVYLYGQYNFYKQFEPDGIIYSYKILKDKVEICHSRTVSLDVAYFYKDPTCFTIMSNNQKMQIKK